jgi:hypothetical protein
MTEPQEGTALTAQVEQEDGSWVTVPLGDLDLSTLKVEISGTGFVTNPEGE